MFNTTTDSILSVFTKTIAKLEKLAGAKLDEANNALEKISALKAIESAAIAESNKARKAATKLKSFFD